MTIITIQKGISIRLFISIYAQYNTKYGGGWTLGIGSEFIWGHTDKHKEVHIEVVPTKKRGAVSLRNLYNEYIFL